MDCGRKDSSYRNSKAFGLPLLSNAELNFEKASSYGTGQLITDALNKGVETIILGLGESATVDAGLGLFQALGLQLEPVPVPTEFCGMLAL